MNVNLFKRVVLGSPLNSQILTVYRNTGEIIKGRWSGNEEIMTIKGICYPSSSKELQVLPEAERIKGAITFITVDRLYVTRNSPERGISDILEWNGERYKIVSVLPWSDYGYYSSIAARMSGD